LKTKIIYVNSVDLEEVSGQGSFERNLTSYFQNRSDIEMKLITIDSNKTYENDNTIFVKLNKKSKLSYIMYQFLLLSILIKEVISSKNKYDTKIYMRLAPYNILPIIVGKIFNIDVTLRSGPIYQNLIAYNKVKNKLFLKIFKKLLAFYYTNSKNIIVVTDTIKKTLINDFNIESKKIKVISNPINEDIFKDERIIVDYSKDSGTELVLGFVGNIYEEQGVQHIIEAIKDIQNIKVVVVGDGNYLEDCINLANKYGLSNIEFIGRVKPVEVKSYIDSFDVCLATFTKIDYDTRGSSALKILEYLYCNKPVITINVPEYSFISKNNFGKLYKADNIQELKEVILEFKKYKNTKINAKEFVQNNFSKKIIFKKYLEVIEEN
jgi:glycosyltransferase involved in cell wall biosynthesis